MISRLAIFRGFTSHAVVMDVIALALVSAVVALLSPTPSPTGEVPAEPLVWSLAFCVAAVVSAAVRGEYRPPMRPELTEVLRQAFGTLAITSVIVMTARVILANDTYVAAETIRHLVIGFPCLVLFRGALLWRELQMRRTGVRLSPTLVVGAGHVGQRVAERLLREPEIGLKPVAFLDRAEQASAKLPVHMFDCDLEAVVKDNDIEHAILAFAYGGDSTMPDLARRLWTLGVSVKVVPRLFELGGERTVLAFLGSMPVAVVSPEPTSGWRIKAKYGLDRLIAAATLLVVSPLLAVMASALLVTQGRPIFFRQLRLGNDGRRFEMLKFRTMRPGSGEADADWAVEHLGRPARDPESSDAEPRVTALGAILRRSSLDELPQLVNVLLGHMSLIGPRPERVAYAEAFEHSVRRYADRQRVRSGLTGWAQVNGLRGKTSLEDRVEWDNHYIEHWSPWLDFKILLLTVPQLLRRTEA